jgi:hypothetical protein
MNIFSEKLIILDLMLLYKKYSAGKAIKKWCNIKGKKFC